MNKKFKSIISTAFAMVLTLGLVTSVFADSF